MNRRFCDCGGLGKKFSRASAGEKRSSEANGNNGVGEVLTGPYKRGASDLALRVREVIRPPAVELLPFTVETAERYARIRGDNRVSPPDAIHLASAAHAGVNLFLTNDHRLQGLVIPGIDFIAGMDVNLL